MLSLLSLFRTVSVHYLRKRWNRAALVVASIALGVAMLVSTQLLNACLDAAVDKSTAPGADNADLVVTNNRRVRLDLLPRLRSVPGVQSAEPWIFERVLLPDRDNRVAVLIGVEINAAAAGKKPPTNADPHVINGLAIRNGRGVVLGKELADALANGGAQPKKLRIRAGGTDHELINAGNIALQGKMAKLGGFVMGMDIRAAAKLMNQDGICERIDLYIDSRFNRDQVLQDTQAAIADMGVVRTPESAHKATREVVGGIRVGFTLCGVGAMVVGLFLVYNSLAVSVAERRHDIGVLRSMGATRGQIAGLFTSESIMLGLVGATLGVPLGFALAKLTYALVKIEMQQLFLAADQSMPLTWQIFSLALVSGVATAWLAALVPAMQASSDEPADAVRRAPSGAGRFFRVIQAIASIGMVITGFSFVLIRDYLPKRIGGYGGMVLLLVGMLLAVPLLVGLVSRLIQPLSRRLFGIESRLAADNLLRSPGRTGVVVGALAAGVALMFQTAGIGRSNEEPILDWLDRAVSADMFVICGDLNGAAGMVPMQSDVAKQLKAIPGVEETMSIRYNQFEFKDRLIFMTAIDARTYHDSNRHSSKLPHLPLFLELVEPNTCLISENFAHLYKVKAGDTIHLPGPSGPVPMRVLGEVQEYSWSRGSILVDRNFYAEAFDDPLIDTVHIFLRKDANEAESRQRVKQFTDSQALMIVTRDDFNQMVTRFIRRMYALAYMQQVAVGAVAALGVVTALLISVLQRRRELGLLRAVGAAQGQVLHTVLAEATLMGVIGTLLGVIAGVPLEWYLLRVVIFEESGFMFPVTFPWQETAILSAAAIGTATLAGLVPALHAVRLRIVEAIAYE